MSSQAKTTSKSKYAGHPDYILNPKTGRWVKKSGAIGKTLLSGSISAQPRVQSRAQPHAQTKPQKKPQSAYVYFSKEAIHEYDLKKWSYADIAKDISKRWMELPESQKKKYFDIAKRNQ